jgi:hypothetical protein
MVNAQYHEMGKGLVSRKKAGRGCGSRFPHIFYHPAARPTGGLYENGGSSLVVLGRGMVDFLVKNGYFLSTKSKLHKEKQNDQKSHSCFVVFCMGTVLRTSPINNH